MAYARFMASSTILGEETMANGSDRGTAGTSNVRSVDARDRVNSERDGSQ